MLLSTNTNTNTPAISSSGSSSIGFSSNNCIASSAVFNDNILQLILSGFSFNKVIAFGFGLQDNSRQTINSLEN